MAFEISDAIQLGKMDNYYKHRDVIRNLYMNDVYYGDLCGQLLGLRDQNRYIEWMSVDMSSCTIKIELITPTNSHEEEVIIKEYGTLMNKIETMVNGFILTKVHLVTTPETAEEIKENLTLGYTYIDYVRVGNSITISL